MDDYIYGMKEFWNSRFRDERMIWGQTPSCTVASALAAFSRKENIKRLLIPGGGYGRNAKEFCRAGFDVTCIEISKEAVGLAKFYNPEAEHYLASFLDFFLNPASYDAIYCYNVLHLFCRHQRALFMEKCYNALRSGGLAFFVVFSEQENSFGKGRCVEENTFESKPGRAVHYFSEEDLIAQFHMFRLLETGLAEDRENHGHEGSHTHLLRYIVGEKP